MPHDIEGLISTCATPRRTRSRGGWMKLLGEVLELGGGKAELLRHADRPWASATFNGTRHMIALAFEGRDAIEAGELLIARLPDHEFDLPGQIVADAAVAEVSHVLEPWPRLTVELELLLLDDI